MICNVILILVIILILFVFVLCRNKFHHCSVIKNGGLRRSYATYNTEGTCSIIAYINCVLNSNAICNYLLNKWYNYKNVKKSPEIVYQSLLAISSGEEDSLFNSYHGIFNEYVGWSYNRCKKQIMEILLTMYLIIGSAPERHNKTSRIMLDYVQNHIAYIHSRSTKRVNDIGKKKLIIRTLNMATTNFVPPYSMIHSDPLTSDTPTETISTHADSSTSAPTETSSAHVDSSTSAHTPTEASSTQVDSSTSTPTPTETSSAHVDSSTTTETSSAHVDSSTTTETSFVPLQTPKSMVTPFYMAQRRKVIELPDPKKQDLFSLEKPIPITADDILSNQYDNYEFNDNCAVIPYIGRNIKFSKHGECDVFITCDVRSDFTYYTLKLDLYVSLSRLILDYHISNDPNYVYIATDIEINEILVDDYLPHAAFYDILSSTLTNNEVRLYGSIKSKLITEKDTTYARTILNKMNSNHGYPLSNLYWNAFKIQLPNLVHFQKVPISILQQSGIIKLYDTIRSIKSASDACDAFNTPEAHRIKLQTTLDIMLYELRNQHPVLYRRTLKNISQISAVLGNRADITNPYNVYDVYKREKGDNAERILKDIYKKYPVHRNLDDAYGEINAIRKDLKFGQFESINPFYDSLLKDT